MSEVAVFDTLRYHIEVDNEGTRFYYNSAGQLHRTNGPAIEWSNGTKSWFQYGLRHRTDGAAIEYTTGSEEWYLNGLHHRVDGPAVEYTNGYKRWFINGEELSESEFNQEVKRNV